jgi:hypothetical protein
MQRSSAGPTPSKVRHTVGYDAIFLAIAGWFPNTAISDSAVSEREHDLGHRSARPV